MDVEIERLSLEVHVEVLPGLVAMSDRTDLPVLQLDLAPFSLAGRSSRNDVAGPPTSDTLIPVRICHARAAL